MSETGASPHVNDSQSAPASTTAIRQVDRLEAASHCSADANLASDEAAGDPDTAMCRELERSHLGNNPAHRWSSVATFRAGELVAGRYVVEAFLARGGMGELYATFDQALGERVALKTLLSVMADDPEAVAALRTEVRLARRVAHPNVCRVHDIGVCDDDPRDVLHFMTMELIEGETLAARLRRHRLSSGECLRIARQLLRGLDAIHRAGILHRDIKSQNVLLRPEERLPCAVLADFGLARPLNERRRAPGKPFAGSPAYMAPEQLLGHELSPRSDLFAFGVLLCELFTGRLPLRAPGRLSALSDGPSLHELQSSLPAPLVTIISSCLRLEPGERPASARALLAAIEAVRH